MKSKTTFFWFRRDLRLHDNTGLYHSLKSGHPVQCVFIFDKNILDKLENKHDARVIFIHRQLEKLDEQLKEYGSSLITSYSTPDIAWKKWIKEFNISEVYTNHDYEPYAGERDSIIEKLLSENNIPFYSFKDQVLFEKDEVIKDDGNPYTVFTPYKNKYLKLLSPQHYQGFSTQKYFSNFSKSTLGFIIPLPSMGFFDFEVSFPDSKIRKEVLYNYSTNRDYPAKDGTSLLSIHLRFGTVSIRELVSTALKNKSDVWLNELIWRDFYHMILWHFPHVSESPFKPAYNCIPWRNNESEFKKWCDGNTGYPIVDAGMRELNTTGFMHNRVRMITAGFLVKHLLIDWRWGEAYFAGKLLDFDLAANNGGWQWAAGSGCDAAPYFRIFNPYEQTRRFDPNQEYIRKWIPEIDDFTYPKPLVEHSFARNRCLDVYKKALSERNIK